ncbi:MAG: hypothetical protein ACREIS_00820 [Nitrospiraceae bacterium]
MAEPMEREEPETDYERFLDESDLDCSRYGCWKPMEAIVEVDEVAGRIVEVSARDGYCMEHVPPGSWIIAFLET